MIQHNIEPETNLLCQLMLDNDVYYKVQPKAWHFRAQRNRAIFERIEKMLLENVQVDLYSLSDKMPNERSYLADISNRVSSSANAEFYAGRAVEEATRDELKQLSYNIQDMLKNSCNDELSKEVINYIEEKLDLVETGGEEYKIIKASDVVTQIIEEVETRYKLKGELPGIQTGFTRIDNITMGFQSERLVIIGARPSQGKSAIMLNMLSHIANNECVGVLSLESSWKELLMREFASLSRINSQRLVSGTFKPSDFARIQEAAGNIYNKKLYIYDKPNCDLRVVIGQARRMVNKHGCKILFIDYIQLVQTDAENDRERVAKVSKRLKDLARELKVPIVALAQLRRDSEGRRPTLADFQHTSQIEQDADTAILLYHRVVDANGKTLKKTKPDNEYEKTEIYALVDKNRDGRTAAVRLHFDAETVTFSELE